VSFDDPGQTTQTRPKAFVSPYDDYAFGGNITAGTKLTDWNTLKAAFHFRRDSHKESQTYNPNPMMFPADACPAGQPLCRVEPWQQNLEDT
jgi:iron complex outermembrane receptor protein